MTYAALALACSCSCTQPLVAKVSYKAEQTLLPTEPGVSNNGNSTGYGSSIAKNGDYLFVAAPTTGFQPAPIGNMAIAMGAIYVYKKTGSEYVQTQIITNSFLNFLGAQQIESHKDWLFISRPATAGFRGSFQVYRLNAETGIWELTQELNNTIQGLYDLTAGDRTSNSFSDQTKEHGAFFGFNFDVDATLGQLLVSAQYQKNKKKINSGAVFAFTLDPKTNLWVFKQQIINPRHGAVKNDTFGANVVVHNNLALISTGAVNPAPKVKDGHVYVFEMINGEWKYVQKITGKPSKAPATVGNAFGASLVMNDDWALIGSPLEARSKTQLYSGAVYFYEITGKVGHRRLHLKQKARSDDHSSVFTGYSHLALYDDTALISDPCRSGHQGARQGGILVFTLGDKRWHRQKVLIDRKGTAFSFFGEGVALSRKHAFGGTDQFLLSNLYNSLHILPAIPPGAQPEKVIVFKKK